MIWEVPILRIYLRRILKMYHESMAWVKVLSNKISKCKTGRNMFRVEKFGAADLADLGRESVPVLSSLGDEWASPRK